MGGCGDRVTCLFPGRRESTLEPSTLLRGPADQPGQQPCWGMSSGNRSWPVAMGPGVPAHGVVALGTLEEAAFLASPGEQRQNARGSKSRLARPRGEGCKINHAAALFVCKRSSQSPQAPTRWGLG